MPKKKNPGKRPTRAEVVRYIKANPKRYPLGVNTKGRDAFRDTAGTGYKTGVGQISERTDRRTLRNSTQKSMTRTARARGGVRSQINRSTGVSRANVTNATRMQQMADAIYVFGYAT